MDEKTTFIKDFLYNLGFNNYHLEDVTSENKETIYCILKGEILEIETNDPIINRFLGHYNYKGNPEKYYNKAIELGDIKSLNSLGQYFYDKKNYVEIKKYLFEAIKKENSCAMIALGYYYQNVEKNYEEMLKYYLMSIDHNNEDSDVLVCIGSYYEKIKDYNEMKKYYQMAINKKNTMAMNKLGIYYRFIEKNYEEMKKYYLMAIELGNCDSMNNLGQYYKFIEENYEEMKKYYLMAIDNNNSKSMNNLGNYYQFIEKNYEEMKKYYLMAIENDNTDAMNNLATYYDNIEKNYDEMKKYYMMAIEKNHLVSMYQYALYFQEIELNYEKMKKYFIMCLEHSNASEYTELIVKIYLLLGLHFKIIENNDDNMIKYYIKAIEIGGDNVLNKLISENNKHDILEIFLIGASKNNQECINLINTILDETFSITYAIKVYKYLDNKNLNKINEYLRIHYVLKKFDVDNLLPSEDCIVCTENTKMVIFQCGHKICCECYDNFILKKIILCPICREKIVVN